MRFIVADDSLPARKYIAGILTRNGHEVVAEARNGREAVDLCVQHRPDGIFLDISMPGVTGLEAARAILAAKTATYVFVASSLSMDAVSEQIRKLGIPFIGKPYREPRVLAALAEVIDAESTRCATAADE